jgi:hypothetical protein
MFHQGPQINVILTDDEQKGTRIDATHEKRKLIEPMKGIKKRASSDLIVLVLGTPIEKQASSSLMDLVLELAEIEKAAQVWRPRIPGAKALLTPWKVAPEKPPKPKVPKPTPTTVERAFRRPKEIEGVGYTRTPEGKIELVEPGRGPAPKGFEFIRKREVVHPPEPGEKPVVKKVRTPARELLKKVPLIGRKLKGKGIEMEFPSEKAFQARRAKPVAHPLEVPAQVGRMAQRALGRGWETVKKVRHAPIIGAFGRKGAIARYERQMPTVQRDVLSELKKQEATLKGKELKGLQATIKRIEKAYAPKKEVAPELKGVPPKMRGKEGVEFIKERAIPAAETWKHFRGQSPEQQARMVQQSGLYVRGRKGGERKASLDEAREAIKEYRKTGKITGDLRGTLGEAWHAHEPLVTKKTPEWFKKKKGEPVVVPASAEAIAKAERAKAFGVGIKGKGREIRREYGADVRRKRLEEEGRAAVKEKPVPLTSQQKREQAVKEMKEREAAKKVAPPPTAAPIAIPKTVGELRGMAAAGTIHNVTPDQIKSIMKGHAAEPAEKAMLERQFLHQQRESGAAAQRKKAVGEGLERAAGPPEPKVAPGEAARKKELEGMLAETVKSTGSAVPMAQNMLANAVALPPGPESDARRIRLQKFYEDVQKVPPAGAKSKFMEHMKKYPEDLQLTSAPPAGAGVSVVETGGPAVQPYAAPKMVMSAADKGAMKDAKKWVKEVKKIYPEFNPEDVAHFEYAKSQVPLSPNAEKAFVRSAAPPAPATTRTFAAGPETGIPAVSEAAQREMQAKAKGEAMGILPPTTVATGAEPPTTGAGVQGYPITYRPETGGPPATPEGMASQQQRMTDIISGRQTPQLQALMEQGGVKPGGGMVEGMAGIAPWILMPSLLGAMGFEGTLSQLLGYAAIPSIQGRVQTWMGRDPEAIRRVQEAYIKGLKSVPAGGKGGAAPIPPAAGPAAAGQVM